MKIGFDARMIFHSGIGTYIRGILNILTSMENLDFTLFGNLSKIADYPAKKVLADFPIYSIREQLFFPQILRKHSLELLHVPHYNVPLGYKGNMVVTIHDLIHLRYPPSRAAYIYARLMFESVCKRAKIIIAVSNNTKKDIVKLLGVDERKIRVIYEGLGNKFDQSHTNMEQSNSDSGYILYIGNIKPTKNIFTLVKAFLIAKQNFPEMRLVIAGKNFMSKETKQYQNCPEIQFLGEVPHQEIEKLYKNAKIFIFPSFYEGFGLPPLEAMAYGIPVICSNSSSLPEVVGDAAMLFDPQNVNELSGLIVALWKDKEKRKTLSMKGIEQVKKFSWKNCAEQTARVYSEIIS